MNNQRIQKHVNGKTYSEYPMSSNENDLKRMSNFAQDGNGNYKNSEEKSNEYVNPIFNLIIFAKSIIYLFYCKHLEIQIQINVMLYLKGQ